MMGGREMMLEMPAVARSSFWDRWSGGFTWLWGGEEEAGGLWSAGQCPGLLCPLPGPSHSSLQGRGSQHLREPSPPSPHCCPNSFLTVKVGGTLPQKAGRRGGSHGPCPHSPELGSPSHAVPPNPNALAAETQAPQGHDAEHGLLPHSADQGLRGLFKD